MLREINGLLGLVVCEFCGRPDAIKECNATGCDRLVCARCSNMEECCPICAASKPKRRRMSTSAILARLSAANGPMTAEQVGAKRQQLLRLVLADKVAIKVLDIDNWAEIHYTISTKESV